MSSITQIKYNYCEEMLFMWGIKVYYGVKHLIIFFFMFPQDYAAKNPLKKYFQNLCYAK